MSSPHTTLRWMTQVSVETLSWVAEMARIHIGIEQPPIGRNAADNIGGSWLYHNPRPLSTSHHILSCLNTDPTGSITQSIQRTRQVAGFTLLINVECQSEAEAHEAIEAGANIVMLDNLVGDELHGTAKRLKDAWRGKREFLIETSGGIVEDGLVGRLGPDVDVLSTSAVHQVCLVDHCDKKNQVERRAMVPPR